MKKKKNFLERRVLSEDPPPNLIHLTNEIMHLPNLKYNYFGVVPTAVVSVVVSEESVPFAVQQTKDKP